MSSATTGALLAEGDGALSEQRGSIAEVCCEHDDQLTRDRLDDLFRHCADLGVDVEWADLGTHRRGHYDWRSDIIVLNLRLTRAQATACLAHELGHQHFGDTCSTPANEERAWQYAAALSVTPDEYAQAEALVGHHPAALATELGVTSRLVEAWRQWWSVRDRGWAECRSRET